MKAPTSIAVAAALLVLAAVPSAAETWVEARTEHFLFIFEPRDRASADELLTFAEDVYGKVTGFYHSYPALVPCVLRGRIDEANGLTWTLYSFKVQGLSIDMALAESGGQGLVVILQSEPRERDALYEAVFLPVIDALTPIQK